jgi:AcrR family transcriptional regulator
MAPEDVASNQRARLFGAMVASVSERGYTATRLSDLLDLSGVSGTTFYSLFADKKACFVAAMEEIVGEAVKALTVPSKSFEDLVRGTATAFVQLFVAQPAAARMAVLAAHEVGEDGLRPFEQATERFESFALRALERSPEMKGTPPALITAWVGGMIEIARDRLRLGTEETLPGLVDGYVDLVLSYRPPPQPLRLSVRPPTPAPETIDAHDHSERALRALSLVAAESGYANITVNQIINRASMSATTFYANFGDKEDALMAAIDSAGAQLMAATIPAFRRTQDWGQAVRAAWGAFFNFLASRPSLANLLLVEVYAAGPTALSRREEALRPLEMLFAQGRLRSPQVPWIAREAIPGGILALAHRELRRGGPESLPAVAPVSTYLTLAPYLGIDEASVAANGGGRSRAARTLDTPDRILLAQTFNALSRGEWTVEELTAALGSDPQEVDQALEELVRSGMISVLEEDDGDTRYAAQVLEVEDDEWARMSLRERENHSRTLVYVMIAELEQSIESGTFDATVDRTLIRFPVLVDQEGWKEMMEIHRRVVDELFAVQFEATKRLREGGTPIEGSSFQMLFQGRRNQSDIVAPQPPDGPEPPTTGSADDPS